MLVGPEQKKFVLHRSILDDRSVHVQFFVHKTSTSMELKHVDPKVFEAYIHWIYTSEIDSRRIPDGNQVPENLKPTWVALVRLWELGEYMEDSELCNKLSDNKLSDMMVEKFEPNPNMVGGQPAAQQSQGFFAAVEYVTECEQSIRRLRDLFADLCFTGFKTGHTYYIMMGGLSKETLLSFVRRWAEGKEATRIPDAIKDREDCKVKYHRGQTRYRSRVFRE